MSEKRLVVYVEASEPVGSMKMYVDIPEGARLTHDVEKDVLFLHGPGIRTEAIRADYWEWEETDEPD